MFATISRGWALTKLSFRVIGQDKELLLFPIFSGIGLLFLLAGFGGLGWQMQHSGATDEALIAIGLIYYFLAFFVTIYFNTAMVSSALIRLDGRNPTLADGFRGANGRLGKIFGWALVAATVGMILQILQNIARDNRNFIGQILAQLAGVAWSIATYFVVPVLVVENLGPIEAVKRSASTMKRTWGEALVGHLGVGVVFFLLGLLGLIPLVLAGLTGNLTLTAIVLGLVIIYWIVLVVLNMVASQVLVAALYRYATKGDTGGIMPPQAARQVFDPRTDWAAYTDPSTGRIRGA